MHWIIVVLLAVILFKLFWNERPIKRLAPKSARQQLQEDGWFIQFSGDETELELELLRLNIQSLLEEIKLNRPGYPHRLLLTSGAEVGENSSFVLWAHE
jgi:hypothetical protein